MEKTGIFKEFRSVSAKEWKQKIQVDLKGADYNDTLIWESLEGIHVKPFYHSEDVMGQPKFSLPSEHQWYIGQHIFVHDVAKSNKKALDILQRGADHLVFTLPNKQLDLDRLFTGIPMKGSVIYFHLQFLDVGATKTIIDFFKDKNSPVFLSLDPIGNFAKTGNWYHSEIQDLAAVKEVLAYSSPYGHVHVMGAHGSLYQQAGANMVQQLAYTVAHMVEYLQYGLQDTSLPLFHLALGSNYFFEIAKLRAMRWMWASVSAGFGQGPSCKILATPSKRNKTIYDYNVNMLRTTSECMAAILGGADTICNLRYDSLFNKDNEFGERIARNQLLLLKEESYFDEAIHAAAGSYYLESLTKQLAEKALTLFKQIESAGGFLNCLKSGTIQKKIKESAAKEQAKFDAGELVLLGTNTYQNPADRMGNNLALYPFVKTKNHKTLIPPIIEKRLAEGLEQNRLKNE